jgi:signal transduction histidine kinase
VGRLVTALVEGPLPTAWLIAACACAIGACVLAAALAIGRVRGRLVAGAALRRMLLELGPHPSPAAIERQMATAFGDPTLRVVYPSADGYLDASGAPVVVPDDPNVATAELWDGEPVALILHDRALDDVPGLMDAAGAATLLTVRNARLSAELRSSIHALQASRARITAAEGVARRRLERELSDGAQRRLASVRARLTQAAADGAGWPPELLAELRAATDEAAETLDDSAHGIYPRQLVEQGLVPTLRSRLGASPQIVLRGPPSRGPDESEGAVFFSCLEAVQNALKHAGDRMRVTITLAEHDDELSFAVRDDGCGFDVALAGAAHGLANIRDRIEAVGGQVTIVSGAERGTTVAGRVPWGEPTAQPGVPATPAGQGTTPFTLQPSGSSA